MQRTQSQPFSRQTADTTPIDVAAAAPLPSLRQVLTVPEVARELRCSKAHVHNLINGKVRGAHPLPSVRLGRRRLVRRCSLDECIKTCENCYDPIIARH